MSIRSLRGIGSRRLGTTRCYLTLPPELKVVFGSDKLILEHVNEGRVVSIYARIDLEDNDPATTPWEGQE